MGNKYPRALTPAKYVELENYLLEQSDELGVPPNIFDAAIWAAVTTLKARQCTMQFA
jgi:thermostable 8-oxoguanine DNA glycosylase